MTKTPVAALILVLAVALAGGTGEARADEGEALSPRQQAYVLWQQGYLLHLFGHYPEAIGRFQQSIDIHPTAENHTYLGWSLSMLGQFDAAIAECKKAIALDPDYGNPYNDIGVYLIDLGRPQEAIPWLEKAAESKRYCCYQFPHFNMGRVFLDQGRLVDAKQAFERTLAIDPEFEAARRGLEIIKEHGLTTL